MKEVNLVKGHKIGCKRRMKEKPTLIKRSPSLTT